MMKKIILLLLLLNVSCRLDTKYEAPKVEVDIEEISRENKRRVSAVSWQEFFVNDDLKRIIDITLKNNRDLKAADLNLALAKENHLIRIGDLLPNLALTSSFDRRGVPDQFRGFVPTRQFSLNAALLSYEIDFFGRLRNLKDSALQDYLASAQARQIIKLSLISDVVDSYLQLVLDRQIVELAEDISLLNRSRHKLIIARYKNGLSKVNESLQAKVDYENAKIEYDNYLNLVEIDKNRLLNLMASYDKTLLPQEDLRVVDVKAKEDILEYVVSDALFDRPDIKMVEHQLQSKNFLIGAARAAFFPSISLTGSYGYTSLELNDLFNNRNWLFSPSLNLPIFAGGKNKANLDIANLRKELEIINYEKVIQNAFEETKNSLENRKKLAFQAKSYRQIVAAKYKLYKIAKKNKKFGYANKIDVIEAKLEFLEARKAYLQIEKDYFMSLVKIYKALGGGKL